MQHLKFYRRKSEDKLYILKVAKLGEFDKNLNIQNLPIRNFEINLLNSLKNKYNVQWTLWRISEFSRVSSKKKNTDTYFNIRFSKSRKGLQNRDSQICIVFFSYLRKFFLDQPLVIVIFDTDFENLFSVTFLTNERILTGSYTNIIEIYSLQGNI